MNYRIRCHLVAAFVMGVTVGPATLLLTDRDVPFEVYSGTIVPPDPRPGDQVEIAWDGNRIRACPGTVSRRIIDSHRVIHMIAGVPTEYTKTGNPQPVVRDFKLPVSIAPGPATYYATSRFVCNFTQRWWPIVVERPPVRFIVANEQSQRGSQGDQGPQGEQGDQGPQGEPGPIGPRGP